MADDRKKLQEKDFVGEDGEIKPKKKHKRKTIGEEGSRKQTAIGILATLALSLLFFLPKELKVWWQDWNTPETVTILKPVGDEEDVSEVLGFKVTIKEKVDAKEVVEKLVEDLNGEYGILVENLTTGEGFSIKAKQDYGAASIGKMPILVEYYEQVDKGEIDPEEIYVLKEKDRWAYGTGSMQNQSAGTEYTYQEVADLTANQSDNMGAQLLSKWVGVKMPEEMTVEEVGKLFKDLYSGKLLSHESKEKLFDSLTDTANEDRITAGVPSGVKVVHKFGSEEGIVNDCGIVYADEPYLICLMSTEINEGEAQEVLPKISRVVWEWIGE
jgi:beta-lactamase class A